MEDFIQKIKEFKLDKLKYYMIITDKAYPHGGGEAFMWDTILPMKNKNFLVFWLSFNNSVTELKEDKNCIFCNFNSFQVESFQKVVSIIYPDVVHTQGLIALKVYPIFEKLRIPCLVGFHFWFGIFKEIDNIDMISKNYTLDVFYNQVKTKYVVSDFMNYIISMNRGQKSKVILPLPSNFQVPDINVSTRKYITIINIDPFKGGNLFKKIHQKLNLPFLILNNYKNNIDFELRPEDKISTFMKSTEIYSQTRILLIPGQVDETFSRVAYEAAYNKIPVLSTGKGNIPLLLEESGIYISSDPDEWIRQILEIYDSPEKIKIIGESQYSKVKDLKSDVSVDLLELSLQSPKRNLMFFAPWMDVGLGIQVRGYAEILKEDFNISIFSYQPDITKKDFSFGQIDPEEWKNYNVYYSLNDRESVTHVELLNFIRKNKIGICIIPEICFHPIYEKIDFIKSLGILVLGIPNIETIRRNELVLFDKLDGILCNTRVVRDTLKKYVDSRKLSYIGHYIKKYNFGPVNKFNYFLHVSGYNISRKQTKLVIQAFKNLNYKLIVVFCTDIPQDIYDILTPNVEIYRDVSHSRLLEMYYNCIASIQVSSHEGLGLGFYESIGCDAKVISLNCAPHNEVVDQDTGWLLNPRSFKLTDNDQSLVKGYTFDPRDLTQLVQEISKEKILKFNPTFEIDNFKERFITSIYRYLLE